MFIRQLLTASLAALLCGLTHGSYAQSEEEPAAATPVMSGTRYALDHIFFFSDGFAPEVAYTEQQGFRSWPFPNTHTGQGTTGRYIYFDNAYIEYLWIDDADAADANVQRANSDFNTRNNWRNDPTISPFGIGLRDLREGDTHAFDTSVYTAEWMEGDFELYPTESAPDSREPWVFFLPSQITANPREQFGGRAAQQLDHPNGARIVTAITLILPIGQEPSRTLRTLAADGLISIDHDDEHRIEIELDHGEQGQVSDMRSHGMPVILRY